MNLVEKLFDGFQYVFSINAATFSGAIDIIVIEQPDGTRRSSPFHVRFGKLELLRPWEKVVSVRINDKDTNLVMKLGSAGEAFFVEANDAEDNVPVHMLTSPINSPPTSPLPPRRSQSTDVFKTPTRDNDELVPLTHTLEQRLQATGDDDDDDSERSTTSEVDVAKTLEVIDANLSLDAVRQQHDNNADDADDADDDDDDDVDPAQRSSSSTNRSDSGGVKRSSDAIKRRSRRSRATSDVSQHAGAGVTSDDDPESISNTFETSVVKRASRDVDDDSSSNRWAFLWGWGTLPQVAEPSSKPIKARKILRRHSDTCVELGEKPRVVCIPRKSVDHSAKVTPRIRPRHRGSVPRSMHSSARSAARRQHRRTKSAHTTVSDDEEAPHTATLVDTAHTLSPTTNAGRDAVISVQNKGEPTLSDVVPPTPAPPTPSLAQANAERTPTINRRASRFSFGKIFRAPRTSPLGSQTDDDDFASSDAKTEDDKSLTDGMVDDADNDDSDSDSDNLFPPDTFGPGFDLSNLTDDSTSVGTIEADSPGNDPVDQDDGEDEEDDEEADDDDDDDLPRLSSKPIAVTTELSESHRFERSRSLESGMALELMQKESNAVVGDSTPNTTERGWSFRFWRSQSLTAELPTDLQRKTESDDVTKDNETSIVDVKNNNVNNTNINHNNNTTSYHKEVRPPQNLLDALPLQHGRNTVEFSVSSRLQGTKTVRASLYFWDWRSRIIVSDIDGTITKSDVFGQVLPSLGRDWSHAGVAQLYSNIKRNNYHLLYLTSRPIGSANRTRGYITSLKQGADVALPEGPMLMSPERLLSALQNEVIARRPDIFKTQCLLDIQRLFPKECAPFYAGFGNRPTDVVAYRAVGIPKHKIFIINHRGDIRTDNHTYQKTYETLNELVDAVFPRRVEQELHADEEFNQFQYWRSPLPPLQIVVEK